MTKTTVTDPDGRVTTIRSRGACSGCGTALIVLIAAGLMLEAWQGSSTVERVLYIVVPLALLAAAIPISRNYQAKKRAAIPSVPSQSYSGLQATNNPAENRFKLATYDGGLPWHPTPESDGALVVKPDRWELRFVGTDQWAYGAISRLPLEVRATGPHSCHVTIRDIQDPNVGASFDLPGTPATRVEEALRVARGTFTMANYDGGLPWHRKREAAGTLGLTPDGQWELRYVGTTAWTHGPINRYRFEVTTTGLDSCHVVMRDALGSAATASFDLPQTAASVIQKAVDSYPPPQASPLSQAVAPLAPASVSVPDEIKKLAELRDARILTEAEFQAKKTELLARM